ncbi:hypothetical protein ACLKMH_06090 [Psychromonas sp. KJ10-10]|uniref:hypothetical protein n=1 Tax=Psychromonas sp. KJ10-10 TaxID=3391823 RepID=UPI0039B5B6EB
MSVTNATYSNPSQLLQRNETLFQGKNILVAGNIDDSYPVHLQSLAHNSTFCFNDYRHFIAVDEQLTTSTSIFTDNYQGTDTFDLVADLYPKS